MPVKRRTVYLPDLVGLLSQSGQHSLKFAQVYQWNSGSHYEDYPKAIVGVGGCAPSTSRYFLRRCAWNQNLAHEMDDPAPLASLSLTHVHYVCLEIAVIIYVTDSAI